MKRLHLLIAGLDAGASADYPHLTKLIARGTVEAALVEDGYSAALARLFGVDIAALAAIALAAEGIDPGADAWFHADPVHLRAGMHSLSLFDHRHLQLQAEESVALIAALNRHFAGEIEFLAPHPTRWYARFKRPPRVEAPPLDQIVGSLISPDQIAGPDSRELQRAAMECQMLLHTQPVNEAREERGQATVNSLWFWGGAPYRSPAARFDRIFADDFIARALAKAAGVDVVGLSDPADLGAIDGDTLIVLTDPGTIPDLDRRWFQPTLAGLRSRKIAVAQLNFAGHAGRVHRIDNWQALAFWKNR